MDSVASDSAVFFEHSTAWRDLHVLLANGLRHPDEQFQAALETGSFESQLATLLSDVDASLAVSLTPPSERDTALTMSYVDLFEGGRKPHAPPAESPYLAWYDRDDGGLLNGPSAAEMRDRYRAIGVSIPDAYPPDHIALLLEYGSLLLESDERDAYRSFVRTHFEWLPAFRRAVDIAAADAPIYRWLALLVDELFVVVRGRLDIDDPADAEIERMVERVSSSHT